MYTDQLLSLLVTCVILWLGIVWTSAIIPAGYLFYSWALKIWITDLRHLGLVVSTLDSRSGVASSAHAAGTTHQRHNILEQGVYSHVLRSTKSLIPLGLINWYQLRLWIEIHSAVTETTVELAACRQIWWGQLVRGKSLAPYSSVAPTCGWPHCLKRFRSCLAVIHRYINQHL